MGRFLSVSPAPLRFPFLPSSSSTSAQHSEGSILIRPICSLQWEAAALLLAKLSHSPHMTARVMASTSQLGSHELILITPNAAQQWSSTIKFKPFSAHLPHVTLEGSRFNNRLNQTTMYLLKDTLFLTDIRDKKMCEVFLTDWSLTSHASYAHL